MRRESLQKGVAVSIALLLLFLIILVFMPSFSAVKLDPGKPNKTSVIKNTVIIFNNATLIIRSNEAIPVDYLSFRVYRSSDDTKVAHVNFSIFGIELADSPPGAFSLMNVTNTSSLPYNADWGSGWDEQTNTSQSFDEGYGYGPLGSSNLTILYRISYTTHVAGTFYAKLFVNSTNYTYVSGESQTFTVTNPIPPPSGGGGGDDPPNKAPVADADGPYIAYVNKPVTVTGAGSTDDTAVTGYRWDWSDDGTYDTNWTTSAMATHIYTQEGGYTVRLEVRDQQNLTASAITTVNVLATSTNYQAPVADARGPASGLTYQPLQFDGSQSYGFNATVVNYTWAFGDGTYAYDSRPTHTYQTNGTYTVTLTIMDTHNLQAIDFLTVRIEADENRNGIPDLMDQTIAADITQDDIHAVSLNGILYYLVDTNADDIYDTLYNPTTNTKNNLGQHDGKQLIDINLDGRWDYLYDPAYGTITPYAPSTSLFDAWWISVLITIVILVVILMVSWAYMTGRI
ncbi:MAG: PKD domain-containing protein [Candidatus Thermoplasmatota archaeon]